MWMAAVESDTARTVAPSLTISCAAIEPALPKPCTTTVDVVRSMPRCSRRLDDAVNTAPRAVASLRPSEPPSEIGLPVTTPGTV